MTDIKTFDMSFSGLKTHSKRLIRQLETKGPLSPEIIADCCASLQEGVFHHIIYKLEKLLEKTAVRELWLGGGVAANMALRRKLRSLARRHQLSFRVPSSKKLCGDNAAMIGVAAGYKSVHQTQPALLDRKPNWKITEN
jgi:N6-L-threonylcarbamoyladenine synthase